jgi:hypothetical protein
MRSLPKRSRLLHTAAADVSDACTCLLCTLPIMQSLLSQWEEKVARQLEFISELQSPAQRNSMMAVSAASAAREGAAGLRASTRLSSLSGPLAGGQASMRSSLTAAEMGGGQQAGGAAPIISRSSTVASAANGGYGRDASVLMQSVGFGSSFSSASFAAGLDGGGGMSASAPSSPQLWDKVGGVGGMPRRSAFTPGPGLTGMGDTSPVGGAGSTPR